MIRGPDHHRRALVEMRQMLSGQSGRRARYEKQAIDWALREAGRLADLRALLVKRGA